MRPETIQLFGLISLRALAEYDPSELKRTTDLSRREIDERIDRLVAAFVLEEADSREVHEVRNRLSELRIIEAEAETEIEQNFLLRNLGRSSLEYALRMALTYSRTVGARPRDSLTTDAHIVAAKETTSPSREQDFVRLGVMRLLRDLPEYSATFDYRVKGDEIDCFLGPRDSERPVIFVEAKLRVRSLKQARDAAAQLRKAASGWGRKALTVLLTGEVSQTIRHNWPEVSHGSHLLLYDAERNEFDGEDVLEVVAAAMNTEGE